jgi:hypothetical protein
LPGKGGRVLFLTSQKQEFIGRIPGQALTFAEASIFAKATTDKSEDRPDVFELMVHFSWFAS